MKFKKKSILYIFFNRDILCLCYSKKEFENTDKNKMIKLIKEFSIKNNIEIIEIEN
jgi:hypothetical protein